MILLPLVLVPVTRLLRHLRAARRLAHDDAVDAEHADGGFGCQTQRPRLRGERIEDAGLFQCKYIRGYGPEVVRYMMLAATSIWCYKHDYIFFSALCLGLFWQQLVFSAHDLGHAGVTHIWEIDRLISIIIADFIGGLSIGWWVDVSCVR